MNIPEDLISTADIILDVGGWFIPEPRATHVVDVMPWETRGARLNLEQLPGEQFTKETWFQADFLAKDFKLPFSDKSFDLVLCGHTVEDLADPAALLHEMRRVGRAGFIECPSRLSEQTIGLRDRESRQSGHPHHHWIVEEQSRDLVLYNKKDSRLETSRALIPLSFFEGSNLPRTMDFSWSQSFSFRLIRGEECFERAFATVSALSIPSSSRRRDTAMRFARRMRSRISGRGGGEDFSWWSSILEQSRPYSSIPLP
jgi:SAM-dependent methyltransferase